jgi:endonuclease-3
MNARFRFAHNGRARLSVVDTKLDSFYAAPESVLGNQQDALDEAVYIILSFQTDLARFRTTWTTLRAAFPTWDDLERAPLYAVEDALRAGGLHHQKAVTLKRLLHAVRRDFGELSLSSLEGMDDATAERTLCRLPGLSWKGARCVLLYGLSRQTFPVDVNTFRILRRVGVIPRCAVYRRRSLHDALQDAIAPARRRRFHINLVIHGQRVCLPQHPNCADCPVAEACLHRGRDAELPRERAQQIRRPVARRQPRRRTARSSLVSGLAIGGGSQCERCFRQ